MDVGKVWNFITSTAIPIIADCIYIWLFIKLNKLKKKFKESELAKFLDKCTSDNVDEVNYYLDQERKSGRLYKNWKELQQVDYTSLFAALAVSIAIMAFATSLFESPATTNTPTQESSAIASTQESSAIASTQESSAIASTQEHSTKWQNENLLEKAKDVARYFIEHKGASAYLAIVGLLLIFSVYFIIELAILPAAMEERMGKIRAAKEVLNVYIEKGSVNELFNKSEIRGKEGFHLSFENTPNRTYEINIKDSLVRPEGDGKEKAAENKVDSKNEPKKDTKTEDPKMEPEGNKKKDTKKQETSKEK